MWFVQPHKVPAVPVIGSKDKQDLRSFFAFSVPTLSFYTAKFNPGATTFSRLRKRLTTKNSNTVKTMVMLVIKSCSPISNMNFKLILGSEMNDAITTKSAFLKTNARSFV